MTQAFRPRGLVLLALLLVGWGTLLRFHDLPRMVVWHDETFTAVRVFGHHHGELLKALFSGRLLSPADLLVYQHPDPSRGWGATLAAIAEHPEHGPLYYLLARLGSTFTDSPLMALRGTAALLSLLLLPALFWLARELFGPGRPAWIVLTLAAVSPLHLLYAQEARQYGLWSALAAAASAALLRALREGRRGDWILYGLLVTLGLYTHLLFTVVVALHALYGLWTLRGAALRAAARGWFVVMAGVAVAFSPWLAELYARRAALRDYTGWMAMKTTPLKLLAAWADHLVHAFADLPTPLLWLLLLPLAWAVWRFARRAPPAPRAFVVLLILVPAAAVAGPDLLLGGRRSLEARYLMPLFLGLELLVAWVLAEGLAAGGRRAQGAGLALAALLALGLGSDAVIARAESWWNKSYSAENAAFARLVNAAPHPLVLGSDSSVSAGELLSLAWRLKPEARFLLEPPAGGLTIPDDYSDLFALLPSDTLRRRLERRYRLEPFPGSWKWYRLRPKGS